MCHFIAVNQTMLNLLREPTSWPLLVAAEVVEGLGRTSADHMISSASVNKTPPVLPACTWMTLWQLRLKTLLPLLDFSHLNGPPRVPQNPLPGACLLATEAEPPSTARLAFSPHHNLKVFCFQVCKHRQPFLHSGKENNSCLHCVC